MKGSFEEYYAARIEVRFFGCFYILAKNTPPAKKPRASAPFLTVVQVGLMTKGKEVRALALDFATATHGRTCGPYSKRLLL